MTKRLVEDLKIRNLDNMKGIAGGYFGSKFTYAHTFRMIEEYKRAFIELDGLNENAITISAPSTIASVNAFYGAIDANKIVNMTGPGFLHAYTKKYTTSLGSSTVFIFDGFLSADLVDKLYNAGVKNIIVTSVTDYMNPIVKFIGTKKGLISKKDFLDEYVKEHGSVPKGLELIRLSEFAKRGKKIKETYEFAYDENKIAAYFLTGATTSQYPKCVKLYESGIVKMGQIYDELWFDFERGDRNAVFIPIFYATGAVHSVHAGLLAGATNIYKPKYDRFAFGKDLKETRAKIAIVAPSHVATLDESGLQENELNHVKYIFIGGEAIMPAQMEKFRGTAKRLGIGYVLNGYGMTETGSMSGISEKEVSNGDVTVSPIPGVEYRIVDAETGEILSDNMRGILQKKSPCATAGYVEVEKNKELFTEDGWIHTGDVAIRYSDGKYRVFGRGTDCFRNKGIVYAMYDIEEHALKHDAVAEAEVIKFEIDGEECPALVVVVKSNWRERLSQVLESLCMMKVPGMECLIGVRFIDKFRTNPVTSKRDYLSLQNERDGYYYMDGQRNVFMLDVDGEKKKVNEVDIRVCEIK